VAFADLKTAALPTLRHRVVLNFEAQAEGISSDEVVKGVLEAVKEE
jgi:MoxR-like ATPase